MLPCPFDECLNDLIQIVLNDKVPMLIENRGVVITDPVDVVTDVVFARVLTPGEKDRVVVHLLAQRASFCVTVPFLQKIECLS